MHIGDVERWRALDDKMDSLLKRTKVKGLKKLADSGDVDSMLLYGCNAEPGEVRGRRSCASSQSFSAVDGPSRIRTGRLSHRSFIIEMPESSGRMSIAHPSNPKNLFKPSLLFRCSTVKP